jgi:hypothetical protein
MNRRIVFGTMVMAASLLASEAVYAQPAAIRVPVHAIFSKSKMVSFTVRNDSKDAMRLSNGSSETLIAPGKSADFKVADGTKLVAVDTTPSYAAGTVIVTASNAIQDSTVTLR